LPYLLGPFTHNPLPLCAFYYIHFTSLPVRFLHMSHSFLTNTILLTLFLFRTKLVLGHCTILITLWTG
jgi:hypothetical protein